MFACGCVSQCRVLRALQCSPANEKLLQSTPLVLGHQQHCSVQLVSALAQQLTNGVTIHTAARNLDLVGDLHMQDQKQEAWSRRMYHKQDVNHAMCW